MTVWPVIDRELRAQARQTSTYWGRVMAVTALLVAGGYVWLQGGFAPGQGLILFAYLHWALFVTIWCLVPLLTADCLSREKREDTLGLLFLTPLRAWEIVAAKGLVHGLRGLSLLLAALPITAMPILMGGVSWQQTTFSLVLNFSSLALALAAGILASAFCKRWGRALAVAGLLAAVFYFGFCLVHVGAICGITTVWMAFSLGIELGGNTYGMVWFRLLEAVNTAPGFTLGGMATWSAVLAVFLLSVSICLAARLVRVSRLGRAASAVQVWCEELFLAPVYCRTALRSWLRRSLDRNPAGWLERRTWSGRTLLWAWLAVLITLWVGELTNAFGRLLDYHGEDIMQPLAWLLAATLAVSAAGSFGRERESGVMELLLVTPLGERQILSGRLRGIRGQFLASVLLLLGLWLYAALIWSAKTVWFWFFAVTFWTLPVTGLYFSLRCRHLVHALVWTAAIGLVLPLLANEILLRLTPWLQVWQKARLVSDDAPVFFRDAPGIICTTLAPTIIQITVSLVLARWLRRCLLQRKFAFQR